MNEVIVRGRTNWFFDWVSYESQSVGSYVQGEGNCNLPAEILLPPGSTLYLDGNVI